MSEKEIGEIVHYYGNLNVGIIELKDALKVGDKIRIKGHTSDFTQDVSSMQIEHATVSEAKVGDADMTCGAWQATSPSPTCS